MNVIQQLILGFRSLMLHKLRSALAVLGILIGVTAVIWLVAMGEGVSYQAQQQIKDLGATSIIIRTIKPSEEANSDSGSRSGIAYGLLRSDYDRIITNIPTISAAVPMREISRDVRRDEYVVPAQVIGCTPGYFSINRLPVARGRPLAASDLRGLENVTVLAHDVAERLFPIQDPLGRAVQIGTEFYVVVGVAQDRTAAAAIGGSFSARQYNRDVYIPLNTFQKRIGDRVITVRGGTFQNETIELNQITAVVDDVASVDASADIIRGLLERYHKTVDYAVVVPKELLEQAETMRMMFNVLLLLIAGISLVVGGIGIMNIMLVSVSERIKEIGIRKAIGANRNDILTQFLMEAIFLSQFGGVVGVILGILRGNLVAVFLNVSTTIPFDWAFYGMAICSLVGISFGIYPACRAANLDPIESLRYE